MREKLAELCHKKWSGWMKYLFSKTISYKLDEFQNYEDALVIPKRAVERWQRQMKTFYADLPENEKESDRQEADRFLAVLSPNQVAALDAGNVRELLEEKDYDCGLMNDYGGGNVSWWHDYIRTEIEHCNEYWRFIIEGYVSQPDNSADTEWCHCTDSDPAPFNPEICASCGRKLRR